MLTEIQTEMSNHSRMEKLLVQIEQNTRSEQTAVLYKTRQDLGGDKVTVKIQGNVYAITDIDGLRQEFTANLIIKARWKEALFKGVETSSEIDWDDQWNPRIELENAVKLRNFDRKYELRYYQTDTEDKIPHVCLTMNISGTFKEMFELDDFPCDYQALNIWLISEWPFDQVELVKDTDFMDHLAVSTFTESKEWFLYPQIIGEPVGEPQPCDEIYGSKDQYPLYTLTCHVKRLHTFYMWNQVLIMLLIYLTSFSTFAIPVQEVGSRLTVSVLLLICAVGFRLYIQDSLPKISYWTALDKYNLGLMLSHCSMIAENAIAGKLTQFFDMSTVIHLDYGCLGGLLALLICVHIYFISSLVQMLKRRDQYLREETKNYQKLNDRILKESNERKTLLRSLSIDKTEKEVTPPAASEQPQRPTSMQTCRPQSTCEVRIEMPEKARQHSLRRQRSKSRNRVASSTSLE